MLGVWKSFARSGPIHDKAIERQLSANAVEKVGLLSAAAAWWIWQIEFERRHKAKAEGVHETRCYSVSRHEKGLQK